MQVNRLPGRACENRPFNEITPMPRFPSLTSSSSLFGSADVKLTSMAKSTSFFDPNAPNVVLKSLYLKYDKDGSGKLNKDELTTLFKDDLGMTDSQSEAYSLLLDKDGDANVSFEEFVAWLKSGEKFKNIEDQSRYYKLQKAVSLFKKYDTDGSQTLDNEEFKKLFVEISGKPSKLEAALAELDKDGNGKISFQEFLRWLNWIPMENF